MNFSGFMRQIWAGLKVLIVLTIITGIIYPFAVWGVSRVPGLQSRAEGSMVTYDGHEVGSSLIGINPIDPNARKDITDDRYFHTRPSAIASDSSPTDKTKLGLADNDGNNSGASNLAQDSDVLAAQVAARKALIAKREGVNPDQVPPDAVTASASGLDPDISPDYAYLQAARVARVNGLTDAQVRQIVADNIQGRAAGVLGEPVVDVLTLNLAVEKAVAATRHG
jgi:K+-transporting ATPase ATPase C chain